MDKLQHILENTKIIKFVVYALMFLLCVFISLVISKSNVFVGGALILVTLCIPFAIACVIYPRFGLLLALGLSYFIVFFKRITYQYEAPFAVVVDLIVYLVSLGVLIRVFLIRNFTLAPFNNAISLALLAWILYLILQVFNPNTSSLVGWSLFMRGISMSILLYLISLYCFSDLKFIKVFTIFWVGLALISALYGIYQEIMGLPDFDLRWVYSSKARYRLNFIWGRFRKWSFLSDSMTFGVFMAFTGIFCLIMTLGPYKLKRKILLAVCSAIMFLGMAYSGTRTAYAIVPVGISLFVMMTINNIRSVIFAFATFSILAFLIFGPIQNPILNRVRSAFDENDPSLQVRNVNREYIQPFIWSHSFGGGLLTTGDAGLRYYPDHELAGFAADSGFLMSALEQGWIGLIFHILLYSVALIYGVNSFYRCRDPEVKILFAAYICAFFALTLANFTQAASAKYPMGLLIFCIYALLTQMNRLSIEKNDF